MSSTNKTQTIELSQYISTDKPTYLVDYNGDMLKIDSAIASDRDSIATAQSTANGANGKANANKQSIDTLNAQINGDPTVPSDTGLAGEVNSISGNVDTINSLIGNGEPTTSDQTVIGAINNLEDTIAPSEDNSTLGADYDAGKKFMRGGKIYEALVNLTSGTAFSALTLNTDYKAADRLVKQIDDVKGEVDAISGKLTGNYVLRGLDAVIASVTADGVKTQSELLAELRSAIIAYAQNLPTGHATELTNINIGGLGNFAVNKGTFISSSTVNLSIVAHGASINPSNQDLWEYALLANSTVSYIESYKIAKADGSISALIDGTFVPASGIVFSAGVTDYVVIQ